MKIVLKPHEKGVLPAWVWVGVGLLGCAVVGLVVRAVPFLVPPCGFHVVTGHPCPTCGMTRMGLALLRGDIPSAWRMSPFLFLVCAGLGLWVAAGALLRLARRDLFLSFSKREEKWWWLALLAAFLANWAYLWRAGV